MILFRKMCRDFWQNKVQFFSIFLMAFLGLLIFVGLDAEVTGLNKHASVYYRETNMLDLCIQGEGISEEQEEQVAAVQGVAACERRLVQSGNAVLNGKEPILQIQFLTVGHVSKMKLIEGEAYEPGKDGVWLDEKFAKKQGLKIGETITLKIGNITWEAILRGVVLHPEYVYFLPDANAMMPEYGKYGVAFLDSSAYPGEKITYNQVIVDAKEGRYDVTVSQEETKQLQLVKRRIEKTLDADGLIISDKSQLLSYQTFGMEVLSHGVMAFVFPLVFLLIAALGIMTTMTRMTARQRTQIGTLKALGFTRKAITAHYVWYGLFLSFSGAILGGICGYYTIPDAMISVLQEMFLVPGLKKEVSTFSIGAVIFFAMAAGAVSFLACRKQLKDPAAETLKPSAPPKVKHSALEKSKMWLGLSFSTQWNYRDILRNKLRTAMGMTGIIGCSMLLVWAFGCLDTVGDITGWMYGELMTCKTKLLMEAGTPYDVTYEYAKEYDGQMIQESSIEIVSKKKQKVGSITILADGNYMHYQDDKRNKIKLPKDGVSISYKMAQALDVGRGDFIQFHLVGEEEWKSVRIKEIYRTPSGQGITMYQQAFEALEQEFLPTAVLMNRTPSELVKDKEEIAGIQNVNGMMDALMENMALMYMMVGILVFAAVLLGVIVLYNLGVLSYVEKSREIATLKVLGFSTRTIRSILGKQNIWVTTAGIMIGVPLGTVGLNALFYAMPESMDYMPVVYPISYVYAILGTYAVSICVNRILSKRVKDIDMVEALKGTE